MSEPSFTFPSYYVVRLSGDAQRQPGDRLRLERTRGNAVRVTLERGGRPLGSFTVPAGDDTRLPVEPVTGDGHGVTENALWTDGVAFSLHREPLGGKKFLVGASSVDALRAADVKSRGETMIWVAEEEKGGR